MSDAELQSCPFCGSDDISPGEVMGVTLSTGNNYVQTVCNACQAQGPAVDVADDVIGPAIEVAANAAWNRRATLLASRSPSKTEPELLKVNETSKRAMAALAAIVNLGSREFKAHPGCDYIARDLVMAMVPALRDNIFELAQSARAAIADSPSKTEPVATREFVNELGNRIRITIEGPTSTSENILTAVEARELTQALAFHPVAASPSKGGDAVPEAPTEALDELLRNAERLQVRADDCGALARLVLDALSGAASLPSGSAVPEGMALVPDWKGYALLGTGMYVLEHSAAPPHPELGAEFIIRPAKPEDKTGNRQIGESRPTDGSPIQPEDMAIRIGFLSAAALDALEDQLRALRAENFPESVRASLPSGDVEGAGT